MADRQLLSEVDEYGFTKTAEEKEIKSNYLEILTRRWNMIQWSIESDLMMFNPQVAEMESSFPIISVRSRSAATEIHPER